MTTTSAARAATVRPSHDISLRVVAVLALISGALLVVDTVTIAVINRSFDPLDSILFLGGFLGMWATGIAFAVDRSSGRSGWSRFGAAALWFVSFIVVLGVVSLAFDHMGRHVFSTSNKGLHGEWSFFSIGVCLLAVAVWGFLRLRCASISRAD